MTEQFEIKPEKPAPAPTPAPGVASARLSDPVSMTRKNRWKRRGGSKTKSRAAVFGGVLGICILAAVLLGTNNGEATRGPDGPVAQVLIEAFPEADASKIAVQYDADGTTPLSAMLDMPAHLIEPGLAFGDPFARLGSEFGGAERSLSGVEMGARMHRVARAVLPEGMLSCHTYKVGDITSAPEAPSRTRALHIFLNPGC